ncbi:hypothetical protein BC835DRAFT_1310815 [Cytidiella melzeri]|nr:hypothetical protein BC835DRAFT_1310815 [Cytidiella melzeri]
MSSHCFSSVLYKRISKFIKKLGRKKQPPTEGEVQVEADRIGEVVTPAVVHDRVEVPVEQERIEGVPDVAPNLDEGRAEDVSNEGAVAELAGIDGASPTPRDDEADGENRTKRDIFLTIASPASKVLDYAAEASGFAPLKVVAAGLKFIVEHAETAGENKKDAQNLFSRLEKILDSLKTPLDDPEEAAHRITLSKYLSLIPLVSVNY